MDRGHKRRIENGAGGGIYLNVYACMQVDLQRIYYFMQVDLQRIYYFIRTVNIVYIVEGGIKKYWIEVAHCLHRTRIESQ